MAASARGQRPEGPSRKRRYTGAQKAMLVAGVIIIMSMVLSGVASVFQQGPLF